MGSKYYCLLVVYFQEKIIFYLNLILFPLLGNNIYLNYVICVVNLLYLNVYS